MSKTNLSFDPFDRTEYADFDGPGYRTVNRKLSSKKMEQSSFPATDTASMLASIPRDHNDVYFSQFSYSEPNRRALNLLEIHGAFCDLDYYKVVGADQARLRSPDRVKGEIIEFVRQELMIPMPSTIIYSGNGYYVKWHFAERLPVQKAPKYARLMERIGDLFQPFGADPNARSLSQILRMVDTVNSKTENRARILWRTPGDAGNRARTYDFDDLYDEIVGNEEEEEKPERLAVVPPVNQNRRKRENSLNYVPDWEEYYWKVALDIQTVIKIRFGTEEVPKGWRDVFAFATAICLAHSRIGDFRMELEAWATKWVPSMPWEEVEGYVSSLQSRIRMYQQGKRVVWGDQEWTPIYTPNKFWWLQILGIRSKQGKWLQMDEGTWRALQPSLFALFDKEEKVRRRKAQRHQAGALPWTEHAQNRADNAETRREVAKFLRAKELMSDVEIAVKMGVDPRTVRRWLNVK